MSSSSTSRAVAVPPNLSIPPPNSQVAGPSSGPVQGASPSLASSMESFGGRAPLPPNVADLASSMSSLPSLSGVAGGANGFPKTANFLNQLETMMSAVKKEAGALETMKQKLKDMEELKTKYFDVKNKFQDSEREIVDLKRKLRDAEQQGSDLKHDLQTLNNLYNNDRAKFIELQQNYARLEQDLTGLVMEKEFLLKETQRIPELKKAVKAGKASTQQLKTTLEEEKVALQAQIAELEKKHEKQEKSKSEISQHVWQLTEQIDSTKLELEDKKQTIKNMETKHEEYRKSTTLIKERYMMVVEDYKVHVELRKAKNRVLEEQNVELKNEKEALTWTIARKEDELSITSKKLVLLQESYEETTKTLNKSIVTLQDTVKDYSVKNTLLTQELSTLKQNLGMKGEDVEKLQHEIARLRQTNQHLETMSTQKDMDYQHSIKNLTSENEELSFKLQSTSAQLESITQQNKTEQSKYWEEINKFKANEIQLIEEAEKVSTELQEKLVYIQQLEFEKQQYTKSLQSEVTDASKMIQTLKDELEKRLAELVTLRQEKDNLQAMKEQLTSTGEDVKQELKRQEETFKRTLESERNKMKQELVTRQQRIKTLETEKSELLNETQELMHQTTDTQKQFNKLKMQLEESQLSQQRITEQLDMTTSRNQELTSELKKMLNTEQDLRDLIKKQEDNLHEELRKFDMLLKESKKSASQQVVDLNNQMRVLYDEIEGHKKHIYDFHDKEKRWENEKEKGKAEVQKLQQQIQELQDQSNKELYNVKRECTDLRNKQKMLNEQKSKLEMEVMQARMQCGALENEVAKTKEVVKMLESQHSSAQEQCKAVQQQADQLIAQKQQLQNRISELENMLNHKNTALEHMNADFQQLERENLLEIRRLKLSLTNTEQEINELRPQNHHLTKELNDCKTQLSRLQMQNNSSMSNLLEEVRKVEDLLSKERKQRQQENEEHRRQVKDMELLLEKTRYELDDYHNKMRNERQEKEIKINQYEEEVGRLRSVVGEKDNRIEELEATQHTHRKTVLTFQEKIDGMESEMSELKNRLDVELSHRKRLEHRMRSMLTTAEMNDLNGGGSSSNNNSMYGAAAAGAGYNPPRSRGGPSMMLSGTTNIPNSDYGYGANSYNNGGMGRNQSNDTDDASSGISFHNSNSDRLLSARSGNTLPLHGNNRQNPNPYQNAMKANNYESDNMSIGSYPASKPSVSNGPDYYGSNSSYMDFDSSTIVTSNSAVNRTESFRGGDFTLPSPGRNNPNSITSQGSFASPPRNNASSVASNQNSVFAASSPAVDRVSAALALKLAQQNRASANNSSSTNAHLLRQSRPGSTGHFDPVNNDPYYDHRSMEDEIQSVGTTGNPSNSVVEESIRRTQMVINRRLGLDTSSQQPISSSFSASSNAYHETPKQANVNANATTKTPTSGRSTNSSKLHEAVQQAHSLYPSSPIRGMNNIEADGDDLDYGDNDLQDDDDDDNNVGDYNLDESVSRLLMPSGGVRPISPPSIYANNPAASSSAIAPGGGASSKNAGGKKKKKKKSTQQLPRI